MRFKILLMAVLSISACLSIWQTPLAHASGLVHSTKPASPPTRIYTTAETFQADGTVHQFTYPIVCSDGTSGCYVKITVTGTRVTNPSAIPTGMRIPGIAVSPQDIAYYHVVDDYVTCTGGFGQCSGGYTEAKNDVYFEVISGDVSDVYNQQRYCGAYTWTCEGVGPGFTTYGYAGPGSALSGYGPQLYNTTLNGAGSQTKYADIVMYQGGTYTYKNTCTGYLC